MCLLSCSRGSGIRNCHEGFKAKVEKAGVKNEECERHSSGGGTSYRPAVVVSPKRTVVELDCYSVRRELSNYLESDLTPDLRLEIEKHLACCSHCRAVHDGTRNIVQLLGDERAIDLPEGFSRRLYRRFMSGQ
jgi:hypothetical protein